MRASKQQKFELSGKEEMRCLISFREMQTEWNREHDEDEKYISENYYHLFIYKYTICTRTYPSWMTFAVGWREVD